MFSTGYILRFTLIMTSIVALALSGLFSLLKEKHDSNEAIFKKRAILEAINDYLEKPVSQLSDEQVQDVFDSKMRQTVIDYEGNVIEDVKAEDVDMAKEKKKPESDRKFPLFAYDSKEGTVYIVSVRGSGLWDEIWGNIAIKDDFNTIVGAAFDHKAETPGLGAEIKDNPAFPEQFEGKKLYNEEGKYVSIEVKKSGAKDPDHEVDGISGATITGNGVSDMMYKGIKYYEPYFEKVEKADKKQLGALQESK